MLDRISNQDYSESVSARGSVSGIDGKNYSNPYSTRDKGLFIDESDISNDAIRLYEREKDVSRFSRLVLTDPDDRTAESILLQKAFDGEISVDDDKALFALLNNEDFLDDIDF